MRTDILTKMAVSAFGVLAVELTNEALINRGVSERKREVVLLVLDAMVLTAVEVLPSRLSVQSTRLASSEQPA
jgi:hypothetical protein